ncbi:YciI family protein [Ornithinimicrobium panacihumi]|uniref:YciI family protein n=1 Tax=Ornithinimicrobium panacihumi TaxID=2008449 RepID=UPI003F8A333C
MKYLVLLMDDGAEKPWPQMSEAEQGALMQKFQDFGAACDGRDGVEILAGEALGEGDVSTTVRFRGGERLVTDGPFAEAVEHLGGFYLLEAPDLDVVLELLRLLPAYDMQISPVVDPF